MAKLDLTVCAIVPTYNRAMYIRECLNSILTQTRVPDEIIVVNDGSTDATQTVVSSYKDKVILLNKPNGGKSSALNLAMEKCSSSLIWICDDDDIALPNGLATLLKPFENNSDADIVMGQKQTFYDKDGQRIVELPQPVFRYDEPSVKINILEKMNINFFGMLVRKSFYRKIGKFREDLIRSQDYEMALRLSRFGKVVPIDDVIYLYRWHEGVRGSGRDLFSANKLHEKWFKYDKLAYQQVVQNYDLSEFTPTFALSWDGKLKERASRIEKARIIMPRGYWEEALEEILQAVKISLVPFSWQELRTISEAARPEVRYTWNILAGDDKLIKEICSIYRSSVNGEDVISALLCPAGYLVIKNFVLKRDDGLDCKKLLNCFMQILGLRRTAKLLVKSTMKKAMSKFQLFVRSKFKV